MKCRLYNKQTKGKKIQEIQNGTPGTGWGLIAAVIPSYMKIMHLWK
jgi:hypothetical protein